LGFNDEDLLNLQNTLLNDPEAGRLMVGTGGLRKIRLAFPNRGKSGSARVCYVDFEIQGRIFLVMVFAKNEMENLSKAEKNSVKDLIERLEKSMQKGEPK
jgi:hypothetical protein